MRIRGTADGLGSRRDGPMHASDRRIWRARRRRGWRGAVPDVQSGDAMPTPPKYLSSDHDPLYRFHQWQANLRILDVKDIKAVPYVPCSHPFIERLIGTIRRECLDRTVFWTAVDLERKLSDFRRYYNGHRTHAGLNGRTRNRGRTRAADARISVSIAGSGTVVGCIRRRWRHDLCATDTRGQLPRVAQC